MSRFVRSSKFRHVFGKAYKSNRCYDNIKVSKNNWDSNMIDCSMKYWAVCWQSSGGGAFYVSPYEKVGRVGAEVKLFTGHTGTVLDLQFNPFNPDVIATASEDSTVRIWTVPENAELENNVSDADAVLYGHGRKVGNVQWHKTASNVLASLSTDNSIRIWDAEAGEEQLVLEMFDDQVQGMCWSHDGSQLATTGKEKKVRLIDPRGNETIAEAAGHHGVKGSRISWLGKSDKFLTTGFSKTTDRQLYVWDTKNLVEPIHKVNVDTSAGLLLPFYDEDNGVVFLAGKGDGNIRFYEISDEGVFFLNEYKSNQAQRGLNNVPKQLLNVNACEIQRFFKVNNKNGIEPVEFRVPRKSDAFQVDIFPDTRSHEPSLSNADWFGGANAEPKYESMKQFWVNPSQRRRAGSNATAAKPAAAKTAAAKPAGSSAADTAKITELTKQVETLTKEVDTLKKGKADAEKKEKEAKEALAAMEGDKKILEEDLDALQMRFEATEESNLELQKRIEELEGGKEEEVEEQE